MFLISNIKIVSFSHIILFIVKNQIRSITGFQNFLKDSLTIIQVVGAEDGARYPAVLYLMLICAALSSLVGLLFLTACMKRYDATFSSAMFIGSFVISASIMSAVHYQTFQHLQGFVNWIMYPFGLLVLMIGLRVLINATHNNEVESVMTESQIHGQIAVNVQSFSQDLPSSLTASNDISSPLLQEPKCIYKQMNDNETHSSDII